MIGFIVGFFVFGIFVAALTAAGHCLLDEILCIQPKWLSLALWMLVSWAVLIPLFLLAADFAFRIGAYVDTHSWCFP